MAYETEAVIESRALEIASIGEKKASYSLKKAADILYKSPNAYHLRYLQTLTNIASENNSTILFPIPVENFGN